MSKLKLEQGDSAGKSAKLALLCTKYFNRFALSPPFDDCSSRDTEKLAIELKDALTTLYAQNAEKTADKETGATPTEDVERQDTRINVDILHDGDTVARS